MTPFFQTPAQLDLLEKLAHAWVGTPFRDHACIENVGVDCVHLAAEIYRRSDLIADFDPPAYTIDGGHHQDSSQIEVYLAGLPEFERISGQPTAPGDLLLFHIGRVTHHVGIKLCGTRFVQAIQRRGVILSDLRDGTWSTRLRSIYRPVLRSLGEGGPHPSNARLLKSPI